MGVRLALIAAALALGGPAFAAGRPRAASLPPAVRLAPPAIAVSPAAPGLAAGPAQAPQPLPAIEQAARAGRAVAAQKPGAPAARKALDAAFAGAASSGEVSAPRPPREIGRRKLASSYRPPADGKIKVAFFDADSTLRVSLSGRVSAGGPRDVMLLPGVAQKLKRLAKAGYLIAIVSNQNGIPRYISLEDADAALTYTAELIRQGGGDVHYYDFAETTGADRKPGVGMAERLEAALKAAYGPNAAVDKRKSLMVGDSAYKPGDKRPDGRPGDHFSNADRRFAEAYGVKFREPAVFFGWRKRGVDVFHNKAEVEEYLKRTP